MILFHLKHIHIHATKYLAIYWYFIIFVLFSRLNFFFGKYLCSAISVDVVLTLSIENCLFINDVSISGIQKHFQSHLKFHIALALCKWFWHEPTLKTCMAEEQMDCNWNGNEEIVMSGDLKLVNMNWVPPFIWMNIMAWYVSIYHKYHHKYIT